MSVSGIISRALYQTALPAVFQAGASSKTGFGSARGSALGLQDSLVDLYRIGGRLAAKIRQMQRAFEVPFASGRVGGGKVASGLVLQPVTFTTLTGTAEVNATPTSFSPFGPSWKRGSTAAATATGVYDGSDGTAEMKVHVVTGGAVGGPAPLLLRVTVNSDVENISIPALAPPGTPFTLSNGIVLSFGAGNLARNDEISINLNSTVGSAVNPDLQFDGTRNSYPNFEYGSAITAGSFQVNGVTIDVSASDTLNQVLSRITASSAGVSAVFDPGTETVRLSATTAGALPIVLSNDSSGFLAATKLAGASAVTGRSEQTDVIGIVPRLSGISTGTIFVNRVPIAVNVGVDSVEDVLGRINNSGAGVVASIEDGKVQVSSNSPFTLDDGTSGFWAGLGIRAGQYGISAGVRSGSAVDQAVRRMREFAALMNEFFKNGGLSELRSGSLRNRFMSRTAEAFRTEGPRFDSGFGIVFDFDADSEDVLALSAEGEQELRDALVSNPQKVKDLFLRSLTATGQDFFDLLGQELHSVQNEIIDRFGAIGLNLDIFA